MENLDKKTKLAVSRSNSLAMAKKDLLMHFANLEANSLESVFQLTLIHLPCSASFSWLARMKGTEAGTTVIDPQ